MRTSVILMTLALLVTGESLRAECISKDGEHLGTGFLECVKNGNRYLGEIEPSLMKYLMGTWSTNCTEMKSKIVYQFTNKQLIGQLYYIDTKDKILKSPAFLEIIGLRSSGGLVYLAGKSHATYSLGSPAPINETSSYVLVVYKEIDKNTRVVEEGYIVREGNIEQDIKDGVFVKNGEKMNYSRCLADSHP